MESDDKTSAMKTMEPYQSNMIDYKKNPKEFYDATRIADLHVPKD